MRMADTNRSRTVEPDQWVWVYRDRAVGPFETADEALTHMHENLHWTRQSEVLISQLSRPA